MNNRAILIGHLKNNQNQILASEPTIHYKYESSGKKIHPSV